MKVITVSPSNNIFTELGNNTYTFDEVLSELIDNSIAARQNKLDVVIEIEMANDSPKMITIIDNAKGIPIEELPTALSPAAKQSRDSLNEHGLGMKQAIASLGTLNKLVTKTTTDQSAHQITKLVYGPVDVDSVDEELIADCGTVVQIRDVNKIADVTEKYLKETCIPILGARYRRYLKKRKEPFSITVRRVAADGKVTFERSIKPFEPIYFNQGSRDNKPELQSIDLRKGDWVAQLTFGYAPEDEEYEALGIEKVKKWHPYAVSRPKQGLDVIMHDRVILFAQLAEIELVSSEHSDFNLIRGEIDLKKGFKTANTKNAIMSDSNFRELCAEVKKILSGEKPAYKNAKKKDYLGGRRVNYDMLPEKLLEKRLARYLRSNPFKSYQTVTTQFSIGEINANVDIRADEELFELKKGQAKALDVYQLFMYMDVGGFAKGYLVADSFASGAQEAVDHIQKVHNKEIKLVELTKYPITNGPTQQEIDEFY